jgi:predicted metal-dependent HD superfamily phosphohydrolase
MQQDLLLADIESFITDEFREHEDPRLLYHNIFHTREVVSAVTTISGFYGLSEEERFPIITAAWFHDLAWAFSGPIDHEKKSAEMARNYLTGRNVPEEVILEVEGCIMATKVPQQAHTLKEKIMADADLFHLGKSSFQEKSDLLRQETELVSGETMSGTDWRANTLHFMEGHTYFTEFAKHELQPQKEIYFKSLRSKQERKLAKKNAKEAEAAAPAEVSLSGGSTEGGKVLSAKKKKKKEEDERPSRGVETLFRLTSRNHMELSALADNKAGIMISVNSIIVSVILTVLLRKLEDQPHLVIPTMLMLVVNISTIIFAILATRPKMIADNFTEEDIKNRKINLLFFGHFQKLSFEQYSEGMSQMLKERDYLYSSLAKDIYYLGLVLSRKYKYLRLSYTIFMYGLILSVIAFGLAVFLNNG